MAHQDKGASGIKPNATIESSEASDQDILTIEDSGESTDKAKSWWRRGPRNLEQRLILKLDFFIMYVKYRSMHSLRSENLL